MRIIIKLLACMFFWGGAFVAGRVLVHEMAPYSASLLRFAVAAVLLAAYAWRAEPELFRPTWQQLRLYAVLGATGIFGYNLFFLQALSTVPAGRAAAVIAANPVFTALLAAPLLGEPLNRRRLAGIGLSLLGAWTVLTKGRPWAVLGGMGPEDLLLLGALACWVAYSLLGKVAVRQATPLGAVTWGCILGSLMLLPPALSEDLGSQLGRIRWDGWLAVLEMAVLATVLSFLWFYEGIRELGAARASAFINFIPVTAALLGWLLLGETLNPATAAGGVLVVAGVWLTNRRA